MSSQSRTTCPHLEAAGCRLGPSRAARTGLEVYIPVQTQVLELLWVWLCFLLLFCAAWELETTWLWPCNGARVWCIGPNGLSTHGRDTSV